VPRPTDHTIADSRVVAQSLAIAAILAVVIALVVAGRGKGLDAGHGARAAVVLSWIAAGAALAARPQPRRSGVSVLAGSLLGALTYLAAAGAEQGWRGDRGDLAAAAEGFGVALLGAAALHLLVALPTGRLGSPARVRGVATGYALAAAVGLGYALGPGDLPAWARWALWTGAVTAGLPAAHQRYRASSGLVRQRLQWLGCGAALSAAAAAVVLALDVLVDWPAQSGAVAGAGTALMPLAVAASAWPAVAAHAEAMVVQTVRVAGIAVVVLGAFLLVVLGLGRVPTEEERGFLGLSIAAAALAVAVHGPTRDRLTEQANRLVYGERHAPEEVLRTFGNRLTRAIAMDELLLQLTESLRKTMALSGAEVWTGAGERFQRVASTPDRGPGRGPDRLRIDVQTLPVVVRTGVAGRTWASLWLPALVGAWAEDDRPGPMRVAPICHAGELFGLIVVHRDARSELFTEADDRVLGELSRQVGLAVHNEQLDSALRITLDEISHQAEELRASRARIVATADAERRRIERNLHDGAQQHLVAMAVNLRLARDLFASDPSAATGMLDALVSSVKDTIQELRDLAHGIYPPLLLDSGLAEALDAAAARCPLPVTVDAAGIGGAVGTRRYPIDMEAAVYFCCSEALQNAAKHAPGSSVHVRLWQDDAALRFTVRDDGPGFADEVVPSGQGLVNMADRLGAIGGSVQWEVAPGGGARVSGSVPLPGT